MMKSNSLRRNNNNNINDDDVEPTRTDAEPTRTDDEMMMKYDTDEEVGIIVNNDNDNASSDCNSDITNDDNDRSSNQQQVLDAATNNNSKELDSSEPSRAPGRRFYERKSCLVGVLVGLAFLIVGGIAIVIWKVASGDSTTTTATNTDGNVIDIFGNRKTHPICHLCIDQSYPTNPSQPIKDWFPLPSSSGFDNDNSCADYYTAGQMGMIPFPFCRKLQELAWGEEEGSNNRGCGCPTEEEVDVEANHADSTIDTESSVVCPLCVDNSFPAANSRLSVNVPGLGSQTCLTYYQWSQDGTYVGGEDDDDSTFLCERMQFYARSSCCSTAAPPPSHSIASSSQSQSQQQQTNTNKEEEDSKLNVCNLCGEEGNYPGNPSGIINNFISTSSSTSASNLNSCESYYQLGLKGEIPQFLCGELQFLAKESCSC